MTRSYLGVGGISSPTATSSARSQPGRQPATAMVERLTSPRLSETARTRTTASLRSGTGSVTDLMTSRPGASGSTTTARLALTAHLQAANATLAGGAPTRLPIATEHRSPLGAVAIVASGRR